MRVIVLALLLALGAGVAVAQDWGNMATISSTLGNNTNRLCIGDHSRPGDIGCPTWAPSLTTAGDVSVSGKLSAAKFIGDGSGLTNIAGASADRIVSGTTSMLAISNTGYVSLTQSGVNTGWFDPSRGLVTIGVSSTGPVSATNGYFLNNVAIGISSTGGYALRVSGSVYSSGGAYLGAGNYSTTGPVILTGDNQYGMSASGGYTYFYAPYASGAGGFNFQNVTSNTNVARISVGGSFIGTTFLANTTGVTPTGQGAAMTWNFPNGTGRTVFMNQPGLSTVGGYEFRNYDNSNTLVNTPVVITSSGQVGIGTSTPNALYTHLAINTTTAGLSSLVLNNSTAGGSSIFNVIGAASTDLNSGKAFSFAVSGESIARGMFYTDGSYGMGPGGSGGTRDTFWSRPVTSTLLLSSDRGTGAANLRVTSWTTIASAVTPTAALDVYGTISATNLVVNGVSITGSASADRIVSGSVNMIAEQTSGTVRISGTLALNNTGNEPCDAAHYYTFRANPITQQLEMCRP